MQGIRQQGNMQQATGNMQQAGKPRRENVNKKINH
jgi:hypothetical protein